MFTPRLLKLKTHSRRVFIFKRCLPVFAFLLASLMIAWPALKEQKDSFAASLPVKEATKNAHNDMEQVRFFSKDNNQNPFTVVAESVRETDSNRQIILMEKPKGTYRMENNTLLTGVSQFGMVFQQEKYLYFEEKIDLTSNNGYQGVSSKVICEYESGTLGSDSDVFIKGPAGMLKANGFFMKDHGDYVHFKGNTHTLLFNIEKPIGEIDNLKFSAQKEYLAQDDKNIFITSQNGLIINQKNHTVTAEQEVEAVQGDMRLTAPKVVLTYQKQKEETKILKITAQQNARLTRPNEQALAATMVLMKNPLEIAALLKKDTLPAELKDSTGGQLVLLYGNAELQNKEGDLKAAHIYGLYNQAGTEIEKALAEKNVIISKEKSVAKTDRLALYKNPDDIQHILSQEQEAPELQTENPSGQLFVLTGNVDLKNDASVLKADRTYVIYDTDGKEIEKTLAIGNVSAVDGDKKATGNRLAVWQNNDEIKSVIAQSAALSPFQKTVPQIGRLISLIGKAVLTSKNQKITAERIYAAYDKDGKEVIQAQASGNAVLSQPKQTAKGQNVLLYKDPAQIEALLKTLPNDKELKPKTTPAQMVIIDGNAVVDESPNQIKADKIYVLYAKDGKTIEKSIALGHLTAQNGAQKITGEYGVYTPATEVVSVYKNVVLYEKQSELKGEYATLNLKTGISSLAATPSPKSADNQPQRVKGRLVPNDFKGK